MTPAGRRFTPATETPLSRLVIVSLAVHLACAGGIPRYQPHLAPESRRAIEVELTPPPPSPAEPVREARPSRPRTVRTLPPAAYQQPPAGVRGHGRPPREQPPAVVALPPGSAGEKALPGEMTVPATTYVPPLPRRAVPAAPAAPAPFVGVPEPQRAAESPRPDPHRARASYQGVLRAMIERQKQYPAFARKAQVQGVCRVSCRVAPGGEVKEVKLTGSSGSELLDRAAVKAVRDVGTFPPVPKELGGEELVFEVPISYRLSGE